MITIQLLGGPCLRSGDEAIAGPPAQRHRIALLTMIVANWPQPLSRDRAMALLWPERDAANARRLLNLAVHVLRSALDERAIMSTVDALLFNPSCVRCDLHDLRAAIASNKADEIVRCYTGPLLDGFHLSEASEFGYWLDERRSELSHAYIGALRAIARGQEQSGDAHAMVATCRRLVAAEPYSGAHAQALMRALDASGDRAGAIHHASEYAHRVRSDLDLEPDPGVLALADALRAAPRSSPLDKLTHQSRPGCVAVLPFVNLSPEADNEYFADGITEDVIAHLSKIRALRVISRASVMPFKRRESSLKEIGKALGATILLDGSVRRAGDRVRIVAKLVDVESERHLWAETYDRQLTDIFAIQTDVALHIAGALEAELSLGERARVTRAPTADIQAYQLFLQGRQQHISYTPQAYHRAVEYFDRAIERDPSFALAMAHLGMAYAELSEHGAIRSDFAYERAMKATRRALELDPDLSAAHCTMGHLKTVYEYDWLGAEEEFKRALDLSPSNSDAFAAYGRLCAALTRYDESIALHRRARELDPLAHRLDMVTALLRAGRYDQAIELADDAVQLEPEYARAHATLGWAYVLSGRRVQGVAEIERAVSLSKRSTLWLAQLGQAHAVTGNTTRAREILQELEQLAQRSYVSPYHFAYVYTGLGDPERAIDWLERAVGERSGAAYGMKGSFLLATLQDHPRFRALLRQMRLV